MTRKILVADLLCGAGGSSTGCARALAELGLKMELVCVNHWGVAIETHQKNHPEFAGTKTEQIKQIGNAVSVRKMRACVAAIMADAAPKRRRNQTTAIAAITSTPDVVAA